MNTARVLCRMPFLLIVAGLPATGKSYLAREISKRADAEILRSDKIRKQLVGIKGGEHHYEKFEQGIYSRNISERTYEELCGQAEKILQSGNNCILDATFSKRKWRNKAYEIAHKLKASFLIVESICPEEVVLERLRKRKEQSRDISDATVEIYQRMKEEFENIREKYSMKIDTSQDVKNGIALILERLKLEQVGVGGI